MRFKIGEIYFRFDTKVRYFNEFPSCQNLAVKAI